MNQYLICIILLVVGYFLFFEKKENMTEEKSLKQELSLKIQNFLTSETKYVDYITFLKENKNTSYVLINQETFYEMKYLLKKGKLDSTEIIKYMTDMV